jgi:hypothetical protein
MIFLDILYLIIYWTVLYFEFLAQVNSSYPGKRPCEYTWRIFTSLNDASHSNPSVAGQYCHKSHPSIYSI